ncbi:hypothetical protein VNO80_28374 [Phaseolus coccineus]|uniref:Uncharacterized protein n=1 Tax=Phaseolus coccineus TaxID=3886 RepID=A0AAN9QDY2_PHACN
MVQQLNGRVFQSLSDNSGVELASYSIQLDGSSELLFHRHFGILSTSTKHAVWRWPVHVNQKYNAFPSLVLSLMKALD